MNFNYSNLGHQERGTVIEVSLSGSAANVRLMDSSNFQAYRSGRQHRFFGGLVRRSPARLVVPHGGNWYVTVDMNGLRGQTRSSIRVIPRAALSPLPEYKPHPLASLVQHATRDAADDDDGGDVPTDTSTDSTMYDVFISHATEDKEEIARPL